MRCSSLSSAPPPAVRLLSIGTYSRPRVAPSSLTRSSISHPQTPPDLLVDALPGAKPVRLPPHPPYPPALLTRDPSSTGTAPSRPPAYASPLAPTPQGVGVARGSSLRHSRRARHAYTYTLTRRVLIRPRCALRGRARRRARRIVGMVAVGVRPFLPALWNTDHRTLTSGTFSLRSERFGRSGWPNWNSRTGDGIHMVRRRLRLRLVSQGHHKCRARLRIRMSWRGRRVVLPVRTVNISPPMVSGPTRVFHGSSCPSIRVCVYKASM